jgi:hypothetical protein
MKKTLFVFISLLIGNSIFSQINYPIPMDSTSEWRIDNSSWDGTGGPVFFTDSRVFVAGDTLIGNYVYNKLLCSGLHGFTYEGHNESTPFSNVFYAYIRSDSYRTYTYFNGQDELLFDFSLQVGDTLPLTHNNWSPNVVIDSIDSVMVAGKNLKRFHISDNAGGLNSRWIIEGIGHEQGLLEPMNLMMDAGFYFDCYAENHIPVYPEGSECELNVNVNEMPATEGGIVIAPNPSNGIFNIILNVDSEKYLSVKLTGISGNVVLTDTWHLKQGMNVNHINLSGASAGIYMLIIQDGNSFIRRKVVLI